LALRRIEAGEPPFYLANQYKALLRSVDCEENTKSSKESSMIKEMPQERFSVVKNGW
jgi:hypothetical protein